MAEFGDFSMEHRDKIAWMIETNGWAIEPVLPDPSTTPPTAGYAYTIGLATTFGFADVVVFGLTPVASRGLLGEVVGLLRGGVVPPVGALFVGLLDNDLRSALLPVPPENWGQLFGTAHNWYGTDELEIVQLVWPDRNGWLPWESGFDHKLVYAQPVIGTFVDEPLD
jgi:hypothetical protein